MFSATAPNISHIDCWIDKAAPLATTSRNDGACVCVCAPLGISSRFRAPQLVALLGKLTPRREAPCALPRRGLPRPVRRPATRRGPARRQPHGAWPPSPPALGTWTRRDALPPDPEKAQVGSKRRRSTASPPHEDAGHQSALFGCRWEHVTVLLSTVAARPQRANKTQIPHVGRSWAERGREGATLASEDCSLRGISRRTCCHTSEGSCATTPITPCPPQRPPLSALRPFPSSTSTRPSSPTPTRRLSKTDGSATTPETLMAQSHPTNCVGVALCAKLQALRAPSGGKRIRASDMHEPCFRTPKVRLVFPGPVMQRACRERFV